MCRADHHMKNMILKRIIKENYSGTIAAVLSCTKLNSNSASHLIIHRSHSTKHPRRQQILWPQLEIIRFGASSQLGLFVFTDGLSQVNIYDNENHGNHLDIMAHYVHKNSAGEKIPLHCCSWMGTDPRDPLLAVGAHDGSVLILSMHESRIIGILHGHTGAVMHVRSCPRHPSLLLSASKDGTARLWNLFTQCCVAIIQFGDRTPATALVSEDAL